jgi:succinyl-CoA synthetase alpha subunit
MKPMGIFLSAETNVLVQGITGNEGKFWTEWMLKAGTRITAGVTPGKEGESVCGVPVYGSIRKAVEEKGCDASVVFVPPAFCKDAAFEALDAGIKKIVLLADGIPVQDTLEMKTFASEKGAMIIGPNTSGVATLGQAMVGFVPFWLEHVYRPGQVGIVTRSGSLTNEVSSHIVRSGLGQTTVVGLGGDPVPGSRFVDILKLFEKDERTAAVVLVGEPGGTMEEEAADLIGQGGFTKPAVAFLAGRTAPPEKKMGHAGAIVSGGKGTVQGKTEALEAVGVKVALKPSEVGEMVKKLVF